jgi:hypothetical protein
MRERPSDTTKKSNEQISGPWRTGLARPPNLRLTRSLEPASMNELGERTGRRLRTTAAQRG